jgi:cytochrome c
MSSSFALRKSGRVVFASLLLGPAMLAAAVSHAGIEHYDAAMNYRLHCEGCHKGDGSGQPGYIPTLRGNVARFLSTSEGRDYIARVPGTAQSLLTDSERAEVLNWIVRTFDRAHLPANFLPYTAAELARWRFDPISQPGIIRANLTAQFDRVGSTAVGDSNSTGVAAGNSTPTQQPNAFAVCAACHTVSPDGAPGIGPNLRGVLGRPAGTAPGFGYSPAMKAAAFNWTRESLDEYLASPAAMIPGNYMIYVGLPDATERKAIIDYLEALK